MRNSHTSLPSGPQFKRRVLAGQPSAQVGPCLHCLPLLLFIPLPWLSSSPRCRRGRLALPVERYPSLGYNLNYSQRRTQMIIRFKPYKSINDLESIIKQKRSDRMLDLRERVKIMVIDDKDFSPQENLGRNHYRLTPIGGDIQDINVTEPYQVILVDLEGVGGKLNPEMQGAHVIREIKLSFPDKTVVAYTGGSSNTLIQTGVLFADHFLQKDSPIDDWIELLDECILSYTNPIDIWKRTRSRLLFNGLDPFRITLLEDVYVDNWLKANQNTGAVLSDKVKSLEISPVMSKVIQTLCIESIKGLVKLWMEN